MENEIQSTQVITPPVLAPTKPKKILLLVLLGLIISAISVYIGIQIGKNQSPGQKSIVVLPTVSSIPTITITPTKISDNLTPTLIIPTIVTITPTATSTPKTFSEEEKLMRKTLAGFEMYIGNANTAGALTFFTPPITAKAKQTFENIRTKNLSFTLKSWSFVEDNSYQLLTEEINGGYRIRMVECRTNTTSCPTFFIELIRNESAENGFLINRYYDTTYSYQNNLGEEIKYQGFGF